MKRIAILLLLGALHTISTQLLANSPPSYAHWERQQLPPLVLTDEDKKQVETTINKYTEIFNSFVHKPFALPLDHIEYEPGYTDVDIVVHGKALEGGIVQKAYFNHLELNKEIVPYFSFPEPRCSTLDGMENISREKALSIGEQVQNAVAGGFPDGVKIEKVEAGEFCNGWNLGWRRYNKHGFLYVNSVIHIRVSLLGKLWSYSMSLAPKCDDKPVLTEEQALEAAEKARRSRKVSAEDPAGPYYPSTVCYQPFPGSVLEINDPLTYKYKDLYSHKKKFGKEYFKREPQSRLLYIFKYNTCNEDERSCGIGGEDAHEYLAIPVDAVTGEVYPFPERLHAVCPKGMKAVE